MSAGKPLLVTMGDPCGVGPETIALAAARGELEDAVVCGSVQVMRRAMAVTGVRRPVASLDGPADRAGLPAGCSLMLGNGSDELISLLALACDVPGATILAPLPGFVMYEMSARLQGLKFLGVPLTADFELDEAAMLAAIEQHRPAVTYIAYPNNPTATLWDEGAVQRIIDAVGAQGGIVAVDEDRNLIEEEHHGSLELAQSLE